MTGNELANLVLTRQVAMESADLLMSNLGFVIKALRAYDQLTPPEGGRDMVLVPRELLRHAQYKCSDLGVQLAIHNYLADAPEPQGEQG